MKKLIFCFFLSVLSLCAFSQSGNYKIVYEADENGLAISGSLDSLISLVNQGNSVRVGWEIPLHLKDGKSLTIKHWADAGFLTIIDGHLFGQVQGIFEQAPAPMTPPKLLIVSNTPNAWVGIIGTTGILRNNYKGPADKPLIEQIQMTEAKVITRWAIDIGR